MQKKVLKRLATFLLAAMMIFGTSTYAMAAETASMQAQSNSTYVEAFNGSGECTLYLGHYIGLYKNVLIVTKSDSNQGILIAQLFGPNGNLVSDDWYLDPNGTHTFSMFLPSDGEYTLRVYAQGTAAPVVVQAYWEA